MKCKKIFGLLLAIVTVAAMAVLSVCANEPSVFKRGKQSIFLVIDDSSSMDDIYGSQYDANYALQTIIAMTDKDDDLKVYFLNKKDKIGDINMSSKSTELIKNIASKYPAANGGTPYQVVKDAQLDLINAVKKDDDTEYCLVIFTDGGFGNLPVGVTSS
ncbi:MAG: hypothetical protein IJZ20_02170, partial [Clostridia bacterium]|nr:hypothetical protein [Clostridia bacterium]